MRPHLTVVALLLAPVARAQPAPLEAAAAVAYHAAQAVTVEAGGVGAVDAGSFDAACVRDRLGGAGEAEAGSFDAACVRDRLRGVLGEVDAGSFDAACLRDRLGGVGEADAGSPDAAGVRDGLGGVLGEVGQLDAGAPALLATLAGQVQTRGTRVPLPAHLELGDGGLAFDTDPTGRFEARVPAGDLAVVVSAGGHSPRTFRESLSAHARLEVVYRLDTTAPQGFETVVRGRRDTGPEPRVELSRSEVHEVAGTQGDPFRVAMLLPGVASIASGIAYPVVRGTQPAATGFFLDGVRVPQLYHLLAGPAVVHPDFIDRVDFFTGAVPVSYGRLLGGALDGRVARPSDSLHATVSVDLINVGAFVTVPIDPLNLKVSVAGRVSYTGPLAAAVGTLVFPSTPDNPHGKPVANFYDYQARVEWTVAGGRLRLLALGSSDEAGLKQDGPGTSTALLTSVFHKADLGWRGPLAGGTIDANVNLGTERIGLLGERDGATFGQFLLERKGLAGRVRWQRPLGEGVSLDVGLEVDWMTATVSIDRAPGLLTGAAASFRAPQTTGLLPGAWAAVDWRRGPWAVTLGARVDGWGLLPDTWRWSADPRLAVRYAVNERLGLRAAAALAHQQPTVLINLPVSDLAGLRDGLQEGAHFELGADAALPLGLDASASVFYEPIFRAVEYGLEDLLQGQARLTDAVGLPGRAYGVELMLRRAAKGRWFGWLSYTFLRSERLRRVYEFDATGELTGSAMRWLPFDYDQAHVINLTGGVVLPYGLRLSAGVHFNTGRLEAGRVTSRAMQPGVDPGTLQPTWVPVSLSREPRLPPFARVDARISKTFVTELFTLELYLDVLNASGSQEVLGYLYGSRLDATGAPVLTRQPVSIPLVLPSLGVKGVY